METSKILIIRNILSGTLKINPAIIKLEGEIKPDASWQNESKDGSLGAHEYNYIVYGYSPEKGLINLSDINQNFIGVNSSSNYAHSSHTNTPGLELYQLEGIEAYSFFLVNEHGYSNWEGGENKRWDDYFLYKAPNFQAHREKLEKEDVERWKGWYAA